MTPPKKSQRPQSKRSTPTAPPEFEAEVLPGLKPFAEAELRHRLGKQLWLHPTERADQIRFAYLGEVDQLQALRQSVAIYHRLHFDIPRPAALLGHQHFTRLVDQIEAVRRRYPSEAFQSFRLSAAGKQSRVYERLIDDLQQQTGLRHEAEEGDLFLRVRPAEGPAGGWEVLIRLSPRPLSVRAWRVADMAGALNSTIAAAMIELTAPQAEDRFLNLMCGSGTLLIERQQHSPAKLIIGGDLTGAALEQARQNITAAGLKRKIRLLQLDGSRTPLPTGSFDVICADLPWGQLVGSHTDNAALYPAFLAETARLAVPGARLAVLTHELKLMERLIRKQTGIWRLVQAISIFQGGLHPKIYLFEKA